MKYILQKINHLVELVGTLRTYGDDPKKVLNDMLGTSIVRDGIVEDARIRNILVGLASEVTHSYAVSTGRKLLVEAIKSLVDDIQKSFLNRYEDVSKYGSKLLNALQPIDEVLTSDAMKTRWMSVNSNPLYQKYFLQRLERDFLQNINSTNWGVDFVLTMEKLVIIYKYYINKALECDLVSKLDEANNAVKSIADMANDISNVTVLVSKDSLDVNNLPKSPCEFKVVVPIYSQQEIGQLLKDTAVDTPDLDRTGDIVVLPAMQDIQDKLDKVYQKLEADVNVVKNVLETGYPVYLKDILEKITTQFSKTVEEFEGFRTTDEAYDINLTNLTNLLIRLVSIDNKVTETAVEVTDIMSKKIAKFLSLFQLYNMMMAYSMDIQTVNAKVGPKEEAK